MLATATWAAGRCVPGVMATPKACGQNNRMRAKRNTFAECSDAYATARPGYPADLFRWVATHCLRRDTAWDCATGNGQAAVGLAPFFAHVYATDISPEQLTHAMHRDNISYVVARAEQCAFQSASFDLVAVAQSLHWFEYERFWPEVVRVARPGAFFCAWGYDWLESIPEVDKQLIEPFRAIIAPF